MRNYDVSNSHDNKKNKGGVRVYRDGVLIAEVRPPKYDGLRYLREHPKSKYCSQLREALAKEQVPDHVYSEIFGRPTKPAST